MAQRLKNLPAIRETWVQSLGWEGPLEKEMATHSSILAWRIPWTEEPGGLQSIGLKSRTRLNDFTSLTGAEGTGGEVGRCWSGDVEFQGCEAGTFQNSVGISPAPALPPSFPSSPGLSLTLQTEVSREVRSQALTGSVGTSGFC